MNDLQNIHLQVFAEKFDFSVSQFYGADGKRTERLRKEQEDKQLRQDFYGNAYLRPGNFTTPGVVQTKVCIREVW